PTDTDTISIDDENLSYAELRELVSKGKMAREIETKQNTKLDALMPAFTKATQQVKSYEEQMAEMSNKLREYESRFNQTQNKEEMSDEDKLRTLEEASKLGIITEQTLADKVQTIIDQRVQLHLNAQAKVKDTSEA